MGKTDNTTDNSFIKENKYDTVRYAFLQSLPVMAGYVVLGIAFGILLSSKGYNWLWALAMSVFIYAGSMQFVAVDLLAGGASLISTALMTLMVNARHLFYGISMLDLYREAGKEKPYIIFALTDETYSLVCRGEVPGNVSRRWFHFFVSLFNQSYWITGSLIGALLGSLITFNTNGIDFSMTALFVVVVTEQWMGTKDHRSALIGFGCSLLSLLIFGPSGFVIPAMILITVVLTLLRRYLCTVQ